MSFLNLTGTSVYVYDYLITRAKILIYFVIDSRSVDNIDRTLSCWPQERFDSIFDKVRGR